MRHTRSTPTTGAGSAWTYRETIDEERSAIRAFGRMDSLGADLLRGTIEQLSRRGHRHITVTVDDPADIDACARAVLVEVADGLAARDGRLIIRWPPGEDHVAADLVSCSGRKRLTERSQHHVDRFRPRPADERSTTPRRAPARHLPPIR